MPAQGPLPARPGRTRLRANGRIPLAGLFSVDLDILDPEADLVMSMARHSKAQPPATAHVGMGGSILPRATFVSASEMWVQIPRLAW
jgi:hypothetical protein